MELIIHKIPLIPYLVIEPIKQPVSMHLVIHPVPDEVLAICEPIQPHPIPFQFPIVHPLPRELVAVVVDNSILLGYFEVCCEVLGLLLVALGHYCGVSVHIGVEELGEVIGE